MRNIVLPIELSVEAQIDFTSSQAVEMYTYLLKKGEKPVAVEEVDCDQLLDLLKSKDEMVCDYDSEIEAESEIVFYTR